MFRLGRTQAILSPLNNKTAVSVTLSTSSAGVGGVDMTAFLHIWLHDLLNDQLMGQDVSSKEAMLSIAGRLEDVFFGMPYYRLGGLCRSYTGS
jgi:hypothetical protein